MLGIIIDMRINGGQRRKPSTRLPARYRSRPLVHRQVHANHVVDCGSVNDMYQRLVKARRMIRRRIREGQPFMFLDKGARGSRPSAVHEQPRRIMERAPARHAAPPPRTAAGQTAEGDLLVVPPAHGTARKRRVARGQRDDRRTTRAPLPAGMGEKPAEHAREFGPIGTFVVLITVARPCGSRRVGLSFLSRGK